MREPCVEMDSGEGCLWAAFGSRNMSRKRVRISTVRQRLQNQDRLNPAVRYGGAHMGGCPLGIPTRADRVSGAHFTVRCGIPLRKGRTSDRETRNKKPAEAGRVAYGA